MNKDHSGISRCFFFKDQLAIALFYPCLIIERHKLICGSEVLWQINFLSGRIVFVFFYFSHCKVKDSSPQTKEIMNIHQEHTLGKIHFALTYYSYNIFQLSNSKYFCVINSWILITPRKAVGLFSFIYLCCFNLSTAYLLTIRLVKALWVFYLQYCAYQLQNHHFQANVRIVNLIDYLIIRASNKVLSFISWKRLGDRHA